MKKVFNLAAKVGEWTNAQGEVKSRYKNVGSVMEGEHGQFILLDKTFNPAGIVSQKDSVIISMFEPKENNQQQGNDNSGW